MPVAKHFSQLIPMKLQYKAVCCVLPQNLRGKSLTFPMIMSNNLKKVDNE